MRIEPMAHTGDSSDLAFYAERRRRPGCIWAEVCRNDFRSAPDAGVTRRLVPAFSVTVHKDGTGELGRFTYEPGTRPRAGRLSQSTVTELIRNWAEPS